ncbi:hypothetical protein [Anaerobacillus alkalilacustris]|nr:hypothetical protein [Anaerobacillus alkalilacustris]
MLRFLIIYFYRLGILFPQLQPDLGWEYAVLGVEGITLVILVAGVFLAI